jgi:3-phenylpropionate/cinnamic acid dioxygenase small subunit
MRDATAITNLLYRYAELIDSGDFDGVGKLYAHARLKILGDQTLSGEEFARTLAETTIRYPDNGTPHTKHVTTNAIVEFDSDTEARARSYYTVFQQVEDSPLQPVIAGRYNDRFEFVDGEWRFAERDYTLVDLVGDLSRHLTMEVPRP